MFKVDVKQATLTRETQEKHEKNTKKHTRKTDEKNTRKYSSQNSHSKNFESLVTIRMPRAENCAELQRFERLTPEKRATKRHEKSDERKRFSLRTSQYRTASVPNK